MWNRRLSRALPVLVLAASMVATPALAAPSPGADVSGNVFQVLAGWWGELTRPVVNVFASHRHGADPDGAPTADGTSDPTTVETADDPTVETENGKGMDPDG